MGGEGAAYEMSTIIYDHAGRLRQIDNAEKAATRDSICIALKYKDGIIMGARKFTNGKETEKKTVNKVDFIKPGTIEKIYQIDEHVAMVYSGLPTDADDVADVARVYAQSSRDNFDEPVKLDDIAKFIKKYQSQYTRIAGYRVMGMCMFLAGIDEDGIHIYEYEPHGGFVGVNRSFLGEPLAVENEDKSGKDIYKLLAEDYKEDMDYDKAKRLVLKCIMASYEDNAPDAKKISERMEISIIRKEGKGVRFERLSAEELEESLYKLEREL